MENKIEDQKPRKAGVTERQRKARRSNLVKFRESVEGKPALRHGCQSAEVKTGIVPEAFAYLQPIVDEFHNGWISDLGGEENLTHAKRALLLVSKGCLAVWLLGLEHIRSHGLTGPENDAQPVLKVIGAFGNSLRLHLTAVGLERQARKIGPSSLEEYLEIRSQESDETSIANETDDSHAQPATGQTE